MSATVPEPVSAMGLGEHRCLSFSSDAEQQAVVSTFVRDGLDKQEKVLYFADIAPATVLDFLTAGGLTPDRSVERGELVVLPAEESYLADVPFDPDGVVALLHQLVGQTLAEGYAGFRVVGGSNWALRGVPGSERLLEYEQKVNEVFATRPASALCLYDRRQFPADGLGEIQAVHTGNVGPDPLYQDALMTITPTYAPEGLAISGEVDMSNAESLAETVAAHVGQQDLHLDLSGLTFLDVAGARVLTQAAERLSSRRLVVSGIDYQPSTVLRLIGWDRCANLVVEDT